MAPTVGNWLVVLGVLALSIPTLAVPNLIPFGPIVEIISPLGNCGLGFTCLGSTFGNCCSQYGFCGSSSLYCGKGCQSAYGLCGTSSSQPSSTSTSLPPSTSPSQTTSNPSLTSSSSTITGSPNTSTLNCATKTITTTPSTCPPFTKTNCPTPECIQLSTIHLDCDCPTIGLVYTDFVYTPCSTACNIPCATAYTTIATPCAFSPPPVTSTSSGKGSPTSSSTMSTVASSTSSAVGECVAW